MTHDDVRERAAALIREACALLGLQVDAPRQRTGRHALRPGQFASLTGLSEKTVQRRQLDGDRVRVGKLWYVPRKIGGRWEWVSQDDDPGLA